MRTRTTVAAAALLAAGVLLGAFAARAAGDKAPAPLTEDQAAKVAEDAYIFGYPLVMMDVTKTISTAVPKPEGTKAPINQFANVRAFPDARTPTWSAPTPTPSTPSPGSTWRRSRWS